MNLSGQVITSRHDFTLNLDSVNYQLCVCIILIIKGLLPIRVRSKFKEVNTVCVEHIKILQKIGSRLVQENQSKLSLVREGCKDKITVTRNLL